MGALEIVSFLLLLSQTCLFPQRDRCRTMPLGRRNAADKRVVTGEFGVDIVGY